MATLVSKAAYAKLHGKSPQAAAKWEAKGCLVFNDGKVDVERSDQRMRHAALGRFAAATTTPANHQPEPSTRGHAQPLATDDAPPVDLSDPTTLRTLDEFVQRLLTGNFADAATAAVVKENALALKHVLAARREAGRLIDLEAAERVLFESARTVREGWMNFPTRVSPLMAAELGIDSARLLEVLSQHVQQQLEDLGEPEGGFGGGGPAEAGLSEGDDPAASDRHP